MEIYWTIDDLVKHIGGRKMDDWKVPTPITPESQWYLNNIKNNARIYMDYPIDTAKSEEEQNMWILLKALYYYGSIAEDDELAIVHAQIGALQANLLGEERGWRK